MDSIRSLVPLFDAYRQFYGQAPSPGKAKAFLSERLRKNESVVFLASVNGRLVGFAQMYPSFSSISMKRIWILNDLFVSRSERRRGAGAILLEQCKRFATKTGAKVLSLETKKSNLAAQRLYRALGWKRDDIFYRYTLTV
jgi:GNAT superfamily N-acetyltransferase